MLNKRQALFTSSEDASLPLIFQWLRFVFLSPCPQRVPLCSVDLLLLLVLFAFAVQKLVFRFTSSGHSRSDIHKPLIARRRALVRTNIWFNFSLIVTLVLAFCYTIICILVLTGSNHSTWKLIDALFLLVQAVTRAVITIWIIHEKRFHVVSRPLSLRIYLIAHFIIVTLFMSSSIIRLAGQNSSYIFDDIVSIVSFVLSVVLLWVPIRGLTGITVSSESEPEMENPNKLYKPSVQSDRLCFSSYNFHGLLVLDESSVESRLQISSQDR